MTFINNRLKSDASLLLAAMVWGSAFVPCRVAAQEVGTFLFNGLRFLVGGHLHESEALAAAGVTVHDDLGALDRPVGCE